jgi:hypothetical protein
MSTLLDAVIYKNGAKNHWRRTLWNRIDALVLDKRRGPVLYLPGSHDLDRPEALRRGFRAADLIAVERNPAVASKLRQQGVTVLCTDLIDALYAWPADWPIAAVIADFQGGLEDHTLALAHLASSHPALDGAAIAVNLQRGRDCAMLNDAARPIGSNALAALLLRPLSTHLARHLKATLKDDAIADWTLRNADAVLGAGWTTSKSRAIHFLQWLAFDVVFDATFGGRLHDPEHAPYVRWCVERAIELGKRGALQTYMLPPYKSTPRSPVMDSAVFRLTLGTDRLVVRKVAPPECSALKPQIAAARAIRTRRLRGELNARSA